MTSPPSGEGRTPLERLESASLALAGAACLFSFLTAGGCNPLPLGSPTVAWWLHPPLFALGLAAGIVALFRFREIDRRRWQIVDEDHLTKGEREYAHREAERQRRFAGSAYLAAPLALSFWLAYQFQGKFRLLDISAADVLMVSPLLGFLVGVVAGSRYLKLSGEPK